MEKLSGSCLCGAVTYSCSQSPVMTGHCHCNDCQQISGAGHASNIAVPKGSTSINGELSHFEHQADSGNTVRRGFCPQCACDIYIENSGMPDLEFLRAGSLDNLEQFKPQFAVYASRSASWDPVDTSLTVFDKMPDGM